MRSNLLSICFTVYRRSKVKLNNGTIIELFPNCLKSLACSIADPKSVEIVISNFDSSDWPLEQWIDGVLEGFSYRVIPVSRKFHSGLGRNIAADHASGKNLLFLDTDMLLTKTMLSNGIKYLSMGKIYYPICFYFLNTSHTLGFWCDGAKGIVFMPKTVYEQAGKWPCPPDYRFHYNIDQAFYRKVKNLGLSIENHREANYYHQYHPGRSVDVIFKRRKKLIKKFCNGKVI